MIMEYLEFTELEVIEKDLWKSLNAKACYVKDLKNTIDLNKYALIIDSNSMKITNMNHNTHPLIKQKIYLLFLAARQNGMPKEMCYCIMSQYLDFLNGMSYHIAKNIDEYEREKFSSRGGIGVTGPTGCVGVQGPVGPVGCVGPVWVKGERGCKGDRGEVGCKGYKESKSKCDGKSKNGKCQSYR